MGGPACRVPARRQCVGGPPSRSLQRIQGCGGAPRLRWWFSHKAARQTRARRGVVEVRGGEQPQLRQGEDTRQPHASQGWWPLFPVQRRRHHLARNGDAPRPRGELWLNSVNFHSEGQRLHEGDFTQACSLVIIVYIIRYF